MKIVSFDALRSFDFKEVHYVKPELFLKEKELILSADWLLYPQYWQVNSLVYGLKKDIFPNISTYHLGHNKIEMTRSLMTICPEHLPYTEILSNTPINQEYILDYFDFPFIAKEVKSSMGNGVFKIETMSDFKQYCENNEVLYIQEYLPINKDMRITYVGDDVIGAYWRVGTESNFKNNVAQGGTISYENIPTEAYNLVKKVATALNINHAGFDVAEVDGHYYFFEFNVMFGTKGLLQQGTKLNSIIYEYLLRQKPHIPKDPIFTHKIIS